MLKHKILITLIVCLLIPFVSAFGQLKKNKVIKVDADSSKGFHFPFFLFVPEMTPKDSPLHLLVEPNNSGTTTDDFNVHLKRAERLVGGGYPNRMAKKLRIPLLVPCFPRPRTEWRIYTHALDRDSLMLDKGWLKRLDLQLGAMIDRALVQLRVEGYEMSDRVFMHGYSASAKFCNRFTFLHPGRIKAAAAGGVNGLPTLPIETRNNTTLPFPIGIADIHKFTGKPYDRQAHSQIPQFIYMGDFDRNDTLPSRDAWSEEEAQIIKKATAERMMPDRWKITQEVYKKHLPRAQCVTYNRTRHTITSEMLDDVVNFFKANSKEEYVPIKPFEYPFQEYKYIKKAHINAIYAPNDSRVPDFVETFPPGHFLVGIEEYFPGQGHTQLNEFADNAGFNFILRAQGLPEIKITQNNYRGNCSGGNGEFQAFYLMLKEDQMKKLKPETPYEMIPVNQSKEYSWTVYEGVRLIMPQITEQKVLEMLDNPEGVKFLIDADLKKLIDLLNQMAPELKGEKIRIQLKAKGNQPIRIGVENVSILEVLMIVCGRASLEYRIDQTTVILEPKK